MCNEAFFQQVTTQSLRIHHCSLHHQHAVWDPLRSSGPHHPGGTGTCCWTAAHLSLLHPSSLKTELCKQIMFLFCWSKHHCAICNSVYAWLWCYCVYACFSLHLKTSWLHVALHHRWYISHSPLHFLWKGGMVDLKQKGAALCVVYL